MHVSGMGVGGSSAAAPDVQVGLCLSVGVTRPFDPCERGPKLDQVEMCTSWYFP